MDNKEENSIPTGKPLAERCKTLLKVWQSKEKGTGEYKFTGEYWEVLYPLLQKYAPEELKSYERTLSENFEYFNEQVRQTVDTGDELLNFQKAVNYMNYNMETGKTQNTVYHVELPDDELLAYIPNQNINQNDYWGREDNSDLY